MTHEVIFRPAAIDDLRRLYLYIAEQSGDRRAGEYLERLEKACLGLQTFPNRGSVRTAVLPGLRVIGFEGSAAIAFRVQDRTVEILRILGRGQGIPTEWPDE